MAERGCRAHSWVWVGALVVLAVTAGSLFWGLSGSNTDLDRGWLEVGRLNAEYRAAADEMTLPPGESWPEELPFEPVADDGLPIVYAASIGTEWAEWYWFDAWAERAVSLAAPPAARQAALERLSDLYETEAFSNISSQDQDYFREIIDAAQSGDSAALSEYVAATKAGTKAAETTDEKGD